MSDRKAGPALAAEVAHRVFGEQLASMAAAMTSTAVSRATASFETAIVGVSSDLEVSILATVLLSGLGVKRIVAKAANELHGSILHKVGASRVVYPER